jgi:hypothetical protein
MHKLRSLGNEEHILEIELLQCNFAKSASSIGCIHRVFGTVSDSGDNFFRNLRSYADSASMCVLASHQFTLLLSRPLTCR